MTVSPTAIETSSGRFLDLGRPDPKDICIEDIAGGLARVCRFGGQLKPGVWFYSVAEHSVLVHDLLRHLGATVEERIAALFHDATEAYFCDMTRPGKQALREADGDGLSSYDLIEARLERAVRRRFGIEDSNDTTDEAVAVADVWALRIESRVLMRSGGALWNWPRALPNDGWKPKDVEWWGGRDQAGSKDLWLTRCSDYGISA